MLVGKYLLLIGLEFIYCILYLMNIIIDVLYVLQILYYYSN